MEFWATGWSWRIWWRRSINWILRKSMFWEEKRREKRWSSWSGSISWRVLFMIMRRCCSRMWTWSMWRCPIICIMILPEKHWNTKSMLFLKNRQLPAGKRCGNSQNWPGIRNGCFLKPWIFIIFRRFRRWRRTLQSLGRSKWSVWITHSIPPGTMHSNRGRFFRLLIRACPEGHWWISMCTMYMRLWDCSAYRNRPDIMRMWSGGSIPAVWCSMIMELSRR